MSQPSHSATDETVTSVLTELLRLYDWRFQLARQQKAATTLPETKQVDRMLVQYGMQKKEAWEAARRVLSASVSESATKFKAVGYLHRTNGVVGATLETSFQMPAAECLIYIAEGKRGS